MDSVEGEVLKRDERGFAFRHSEFFPEYGSRRHNAAEDLEAFSER